MRVSCHGNLVCSPNLIGSGFSSINLDSLSVSSHSHSQPRRRFIFYAFPLGPDHESASSEAERKNTEQMFRTDPVLGNKITSAHFRDARIPALGLSALLELVKYVPVLRHEYLLYMAILLNVCLYCSKTCGGHPGGMLLK